MKYPFNPSLLLTPTEERGIKGKIDEEISYA
jgi:hypothetical protein